MTSTSTTTNQSYNGPYYIFSFRNKDCYDLRENYFTASKTSYWRAPARLHSPIGAFKLVYLNSKIGRDNYTVEAPVESKICKMLGSNGILDNDIMGYHIIVKDSEYAMYVRFATEELVHPRFGLTFTKCFKIPDMNKMTSDLESLLVDYRSVTKKEESIKDMAKRFTYRYGSGPDQISGILTREVDLLNHVINHEEHNDIVLDKELKDNIVSLTDTYNKIMADMSQTATVEKQLKDVYSDRTIQGQKNITTAKEKIIDYVNSYISGV